jgi:Rieske Fe-S protein
MEQAANLLAQREFREEHHETMRRYGRRRPPEIPQGGWDRGGRSSRSEYPDGFSTTCPHKGFPLAYNKTDRTLNCPGHYSRFDVEAGGQQTWGHATQNLPQYALR